ncbi:18433_t:CDS:2 [Funneliformis geosporum]|uniref:18433_t:CDS:1 n=1 Tax=Funneliformis geosporum TaxID=1117311 RepID=A0A9W4WRY3_9GLOM|nr:18433_t:CDS:2 [Funneliformis geosporum]
MTCTHISQSRIKLNDLVGKLRDSSSLVYEEIGPLADPTIEEKIDEVDNLLNSCNCYANEISKGVGESKRRNDLIDAHREERKNLNAQIEGIKSEYKEIINNQNSLIESERRENSIVKRENSDLQRLLGLSEGQVRQLEVQLTDKSNELNQNKQALERLRQAFQDLLVSNATYQTEARVVRENLD